MNLQTYALELLKLNESKLSPFTDANWYASIGFGLVEELLEYAEAKTKYELGQASLADVIKEAGDVLAYVVLVLAAHCTPHYGLANLADQVKDVYMDYLAGRFTSAEEGALKLAAAFKRWFREDKIIDISLVVFAMEAVLDDLRPHSISLSDIAEANIQKLRDRANRGQLFQGTGSNR